MTDDTLNHGETIIGPDAADDSELLAGTQLGDYRIAELIGAGGMGRVYRAEQVRLGKSYAIKVIPQRLAADPGFIARFHDEARVMAELRHPHIVSVHYMGRDAGRYFMALDLVHGPGGAPRDLHTELESRPDERLPRADALKWLTQVAEALAYAHERGVVHRDVKPANILLDADGDVRLTDFGLARAIGNETLISHIHETMERTLSDERTRVAEEPSPRQTGTSVLGSYDYMAPEQRSCGEIDARTDVYAFGVLMYRVLTGKRPVGRALDPSRAVPGLSRRWDRIVWRCMEEDPDARYPSAAELLADLKQLAAGSAGRSVLRVAASVLLLAGIAAAALWQMGVFNGSGPHEPAWSARASNAPLPDTEISEPAVPDEPEPVTSEQAVLKQTEAENLWRQVEKVDTGQGLGARIREARTTRQNAEALFGLQNWPNAHKYYLQLATQCGAILDSDKARTSAAAQRDAVEQALRTAQEGGVHTDASVLWQDVQNRMTKGRGQFEEGSFSDAEQTWRDAQTRLGEARAHAELVRSARWARTAWQTDVADARAQERLDTYGGDTWTGAKEKAAEAEKSLEDAQFAEARQRFVAAHDMLPGAVAEARVEHARRRKPAEDARTAWENAVVAAKKRVDLDRFGGEKWKAATTAAEEGQTALDAQHYENAARRYAAAAALLPEVVTSARQREAAELARAQRAAVDAKAAYEAAVADASDSVTARALARYAGTQQRAAADTAERGRKALAAQDYAEAKRRYDDAKAKIAEAVKTAEEAMRIPAWAQEMIKTGQISKEQQDAAARLGKPVAKDVDLDGGVTMRFVLIPAGKFTMGSNAGDSDEKPPHEVEITKAFYMGVTELTQAQWKAVMGTEPWKGKTYAGRTVESAANYVNWNEATAFAGKLGRKAEGTCRLPTEAEWEYACRAGSTGKWCFGNDEKKLGDYAWYYENASKVGKEEPQPVGRKKPNAWGLYDMHGNVWEWCADWYDSDYYRESDKQDPQGPRTAKSPRVLRGGSCPDCASACRSAFRDGPLPTYTDICDGFRVVLGAQ